MANTGDEFHVSSAQEVFNNIEDSKGIIKLAYAVDDTDDNNTENDYTVEFILFLCSCHYKTSTVVNF